MSCPHLKNPSTTQQNTEDPHLHMPSVEFKSTVGQIFRFPEEEGRVCWERRMIWFTHQDQEPQWLLVSQWQHEKQEDDRVTPSKS